MGAARIIAVNGDTYDVEGGGTVWRGLKRDQVEAVGSVDVLAAAQARLINAQAAQLEAAVAAETRKYESAAAADARAAAADTSYRSAIADQAVALSSQAVQIGASGAALSDVVSRVGSELRSLGEIGPAVMGMAQQAGRMAASSDAAARLIADFVASQAIESGGNRNAIAGLARTVDALTARMAVFGAQVGMMAQVGGAPREVTVRLDDGSEVKAVVR